MSTIYRPGQTVPVSGIYNVVDVYGTYLGRQITSEGGETFPATRHGTNESASCCTSRRCISSGN
jgi:hypothetical protein